MSRLGDVLDAETSISGATQLYRDLLTSVQGYSYGAALMASSALLTQLAFAACMSAEELLTLVRASYETADSLGHDTGLELTTRGGSA